MREMLGPRGQHVKIIAKIENPEALSNFDDILAVADGIMICRAALAMEIQPEKAFVWQKSMVEKANLNAKTAFVCSNIFDSMIKDPRPLRTECQDIASCILEGADCIVLGEETSHGDYPAHAVQALSKTIAEAEKRFEFKRTYEDMKLYTPVPLTNIETVVTAVLNTQ